MPLQTTCPVLDHYQQPDDGVEVRYCIIAEVDSDILSRLLSYFALRRLIPRHIEAQQHNDLLHVSISQEGLSAQHARLIAQEMRSLVSVLQVNLTCHELHGVDHSESPCNWAAT